MPSDILKIKSTGMVGVVKLNFVIIGLSIIYRIVKYKTNKIETDNLDENVLNLFKCAFYGLLAWFIYEVYRKLKFPQIDVLTFFTFLLACFEATHNFINTIGDWIALIIVGIWKMLTSKRLY